MFRPRSVLVQPCSAPLKPMLASYDACPPSTVSSLSPVNAAGLVQLANIAIDSHENALDCRVDSASALQNDIKSENTAGQSCDAVSDGQLSRG